VVRYDPRAGERSLDVMRWGLVPFWAKDIKVGFSNINAKAEGIEGKPAFREAFQRRRCLVEEAVAAYRAALEERTRERVPLDWARTQMNLGNERARTELKILPLAA